jgi:hypothetical protein
VCPHNYGSVTWTARDVFAVWNGQNPPPCVILAGRLRHLDLSFSLDLCSLDGFDACVQLRELSLRGCSSLDDISGLAAVGHLSKLDLSWCDRLRNLGALKKLVRPRSSTVWAVRRRAHILNATGLNRAG